MMRTNLHHLIQEQAARRGDAPAVTYKDETFSYAELWHRVRGVAAGLTEVGLSREDRVAIFLEKRIETVAAIFGASAAGGVFVPVNHLLRPTQVGYILANCDVRVLVTSAERLVLLGEELKTCESLEHVVVVGSSAADLPSANGYTVHRWSDLFERSADPAPQDLDVIDLDKASIFYTSGSTGKPKGVVLSHRNLIVGAESVSTYLDNSSADVILSALPLSFDAGFSQLTTGFSVGAHIVLLNYLLPGDVVK
ncbi:MAG TPA: AMP-binding protein, partial [Aeromicrobium sp.]|nr:AMP-binding protein [Aeromicrobium sp.]